jgi:hypothetical protein
MNDDPNSHVEREIYNWKGHTTVLASAKRDALKILAGYSLVAPLVDELTP